MKSGRIFTMALLAMFALPAALAGATDIPGSKLLMERSYKLRLWGEGIVQCSQGSAPNGHNYPVNTTLRTSQIPYDLWLSNVWTNVSEYTAHVNYDSCDKYAKLTQL